MGIKKNMLGLLALLATNQLLFGLPIISEGQVFQADPSLYGKVAASADESVNLFKNDIGVVQMQMQGARSTEMLKKMVKETIPNIRTSRIGEMSKFLKQAQDATVKASLENRITIMKKIIDNFIAKTNDRIEQLHKEEKVFGVSKVGGGEVKK